MPSGNCNIGPAGKFDHYTFSRITIRQNDSPSCSFFRGHFSTSLNFTTKTFQVLSKIYQSFLMLFCLCTCNSVFLLSLLLFVVLFVLFCRGYYLSSDNNCIVAFTSMFTLLFFIRHSTHIHINFCTITKHSKMQLPFKWKQHLPSAVRIQHGKIGRIFFGSSNKRWLVSRINLLTYRNWMIIELFHPHLNNQVTGIFFLGILTHKKKCDPAGIYFTWSLLLLTSHQLQQP